MDLGGLVNGRGELGEEVEVEQRAVHVEQHRRGGNAVPGAEEAVAPMETGQPGDLSGLEDCVPGIRDSDTLAMPCGSLALAAVPSNARADRRRRRQSARHGQVYAR